MSKWIHRLNNIDTNKLKAECSECGVVDIILEGNYPKCKERKRAYRKRVLAKKKEVYPKNCEVCGRGDLVICYDHDHKTGSFRGWLCNNCNLALGLLQDNTSTLRKLVDYLER